MNFEAKILDFQNFISKLCATLATLATLAGLLGCWAAAGLLGCCCAFEEAVQKCCSERLFKGAVSVDAELCIASLCSALLRAWICTGSH